LHRVTLKKSGFTLKPVRAGGKRTAAQANLEDPDEDQLDAAVAAIFDALPPPPPAAHPPPPQPPPPPHVTAIQPYAGDAIPIEVSRRSPFPTVILPPTCTTYAPKNMYFDFTFNMSERLFSQADRDHASNEMRMNGPRLARGVSNLLAGRLPPEVHEALIE
jgi:hypothetical protein